MTATITAKSNKAQTGAHGAVCPDIAGSVLARLGALKTATTPALKAQWRQRDGTTPL